MLKTERVPVFLYRSTDSGAPKLSSANGSFKTVLKAVLSNGYGLPESAERKNGLGWEIAFESDYEIVFKSKNVKSPGFYLKISDNNNSINGCYPKIGAYREMTDINQGAGQFLVSGSFTQDKMRYFGGAGWVIVGNDRAVWVFVEGISNESERWYSLFFGDFPSAKEGDWANIGLSISDQASYSASHNIADGLVIADDYQSSGKSAVGRIGCAVSYPTGTVKIDEIIGGVVASEVFLMEAGNLRGKWPGLFGTNCRFEKSMVDMPIHGETDSFLAFNSGISKEYGSRSYLVNTTAWEM